MTTVKSTIRFTIVAALLAGVSFPPELAADGKLPFDVPVPRPKNPIQERHTNFFKPRHVYDFQKDEVIAQHVPAGLSYRLYSAVGFNLANSMMVVGSNGGVVIVDTLGDTGSAKDVASHFLEKYNALHPGHQRDKLPIEAIIYTHNHIDHTGGVQGFLASADRPVCPPEPAADQGEDGSYLGRGDCVEVICQKKVIEAVINTGTVAGQMINQRSLYMYGSLFSSPEHRDGNPFYNNGIGPFIKEGDSSFQVPSKTFTDELYLSVAGLDMKLIYVPSETDDELAVFLPDRRNRRYPASTTAGDEAAVAQEDPWGGPGLLFSAEVLQGPAFPNLYSLRGTSYRNPATWFRSIDKLLELDSWCMVPSHGPPLCGRDNVETLLVNFRDAVQFTHDQAVRYLNQGYVPDQLATMIRLPQYILDGLEALKPPVGNVDNKDYLRPLYGSVSQAVRELYFGYLGWFDGDPVHLHPNPPRDLAARRVVAMGGPEQVLATAREAFGRCAGASDDQYAQCQCFWSASTECQPDAPAHCQWAADCQWAAELATEVVTAYQGVEGEGDVFWEARKLKAEAFLRLAPLATNPNWYNWYVTSAMELREPTFAELPAPTGGLTSWDIVAHLPPGAWVNSLTMRLRAERTARDHVRSSLGFYFPAAPGLPAEGYALEIRRAIAQFYVMDDEPPAGGWRNLQAVVSVARDAFSQLLEAESNGTFKDTLARLLDEGEIRVLKGTGAEVSRFFGHFEPRPTTMVPVTVHPPLPSP